ncbi:MAG: hypothetical protein SGJ18_15145 [Pseudomonadota bacterium]|nr:hypothetical protein [Pseudomonadota bacterium]
MSPRRHDYIPPFEFTFWKKDGELFFADAKDIESAIINSGNSEDQFKRRMGRGRQLLDDAKAGKKLTRWEVVFIESGLMPDNNDPVPRGFSDDYFGPKV